MPPAQPLPPPLLPAPPHTAVLPTAPSDPPRSPRSQPLVPPRLPPPPTPALDPDTRASEPSVQRMHVGAHAQPAAPWPVGLSLCLQENSRSASTVWTAPRGPSPGATRATVSPGQSECWRGGGPGCAGAAGWPRADEGSAPVRPSCSQAGLRTVFPGNRTHDAVCGLLLPPPPAERHCPLSVALLAVAGCILVLAVAQLGLHIWQLRKQRVWLPGQSCPGAGGGALHPWPTC